MELERVQTISVMINTILFVLSIGLTAILIWRLKFNDKNSRLLFILYILYWMSPLLCREYTGQMHLHMEYFRDYGTMLWAPLIAYGLIGILWRPLSDIFAFKFNSRKKVIYLSLVLQALTITPFLIYPCFTTNIIQSVGAGIGASCIGLFNLMFDQSYHHKKVFRTVSIIALPPIIAELLSSMIEGVCCSFLTEGVQGRYESYTNVMIWLWYVAIIFIIASFVVAIFIKEPKSAILKVQRVKEPVKKSSDWWVVILVCLAGVGLMFVRWSTSGPTAVSQLIFMGAWTGVDTRFIEAYLSCVYALGSLVGTILAAVWFSKSKSKDRMEKLWLILIACVITILGLTISSAYPNIPMLYGTNAMFGLSLGLVWASITGMMLNKSFTKTKYITPMGLFNTALSIGVCLGTFCNNWVKGALFDFQSLEKMQYTYDHFIIANTRVNGICVGITLFVAFIMIVAYAIHVINPPVKSRVNELSVTGETEI